MAASITIPSRLYTPGAQSVTIDSIPGGAIGFLISLTREAWPVGDIANLIMSLSTDGGATFFPGVNATLQGGVALDRHGQAVLSTDISWTFPANYVNNIRVPIRPNQAKLDVTVLQPLTTAITAAWMT